MQTNSGQASSGDVGHACSEVGPRVPHDGLGSSARSGDYGAPSVDDADLARGVEDAVRGSRQSQRALRLDVLGEPSGVVEVGSAADPPFDGDRADVGDGEVGVQGGFELEGVRLRR